MRHEYHFVLLLNYNIVDCHYLSQLFLFLLCFLVFYSSYALCFFCFACRHHFVILKIVSKYVSK